MFSSLLMPWLQAGAPLGDVTNCPILEGCRQSWRKYQGLTGWSQYQVITHCGAPWHCQDSPLRMFSQFSKLCPAFISLSTLQLLPFRQPSYFSGNLIFSCVSFSLSTKFLGKISAVLLALMASPPSYSQPTAIWLHSHCTSSRNAFFSGSPGASKSTWPLWDMVGWSQSRSPSPWRSSP